jgi:hypothetical protein
MSNEIILSAKRYYDMYILMKNCIYPEWLNSSSNIPNIILDYMGTHAIDKKYNIITNTHNDLDAVFRVAIWHMGNMIYDYSDRTEMNGFKQLIYVYILLSHKIDKSVFINLYSNTNINKTRLASIYDAIDKKAICNILPSNLLKCNTNIKNIFNEFKQLFEINTVTLNSIGLSEHKLCRQIEKDNTNIIVKRS